MSENISQHAYATWAKQRLDEMDAALASFETKASQVKAEASAKATQLIADLKKRRKDFEAETKAHVQAGEAVLQTSKTQLERQWAGFEAEVKTYVETVGKDIDQKRATFADVAAAQVKAWSESAEKLQSAAAQLAADHRAKADKAIAQMRATATDAKAGLDRMKHANEESWAAMSAALQTSRKAFDEANQKTWAALKSAVPPRNG